ncbi:hypothetical protein [Streptomyces sp. NPDC020917]|uniref:hypothetical protein n=1 Tax=Streptomyces sp. NPDC020917 TaxID=3365102 RepID=UPI0037896100
MARRRGELVKAAADTDLLVPEAGTVEIFEGPGEIVHGPGGVPAQRPEDVLAEPPDSRDISAELAAPPRRKLPWLTLVLSACVVAAGAFAAGALVEKNHLNGSSGGRGAAFPAAAGNRTAGGTGSGRTFGGFGGAGGTGTGRTGAGTGTGTGTGAQPGGGTGLPGGTSGTGGSGVTIGTIKLVDGNTIYVTDAQGNIVKVTTGSSTKVTENKDGKVSDLQPGQSVTIRGDAKSNGDIAATTVTQGSAGGFGGFGGFGGGGTGGGTGGN